MKSFLLLPIFFFTSLPLQAMKASDVCKRLTAAASRNDARKWVDDNPDKVLAEIPNLTLSRAKWFELALSLSKSRPDAFLKHLKTVAPHLTQEQRAQIARLLMDSDIQNPVKMTEDLGLSTRNKAEIACLLIEKEFPIDKTAHQPPQTKEVAALMKKLEPLNLTQDQIYQLHLELLMRNGHEYVASKFPDLQLTTTQKAQLAKAIHLPIEKLLEELPNWNLPQSVRFAIAKNSLNGNNIKEFFTGIERFNLTPAQMTQLLEKALESDMDRAIRFLDSLKLNEADRFRLFMRYQEKAATAFSRNGDPFFTTFKDPEHNFQAAQLAIQIHWGDNFNRELLKNLKVSPEQRHQLLMEMLKSSSLKNENTFTRPDQLAEVPLRQESQRWEAFQFMVERYAENWGAVPWEEIERYLAKIPTHRWAAIELLAKQGVDISAVLKGRLPRETRLSLLRSQTSANPTAAVERMKALSLGREEHFAIAQELVTTQKGAQTFLDGLAHFDLSDSQKLDLWERIPEHFKRRNIAFAPKLLESYLPKLNLKKLEDRIHAGLVLVRAFPKEATVKNVSKHLGLTEKQEAPLHRVRFSQNPETFLEEKGILPSDKHLSEDNPAAVEEIRLQLRELARRHPEILPEAWIRLLWDRVKSRDTGLRLLRLLYESTDFDIKRPIPTDSLDLLCARMGLDSAPFKTEALQSRLGDIYSLMLDIEGNLKEKPFGSTVISPELIRNRAHNLKFIDFLQRSRDLLHLLGNTPDAWKQVLTLAEIKDGKLNEHNIDSVNKKLEAEVVESFKRQFQGQENADFTYQQLSELKDRWGEGGLAPVITLVSRYNGKGEWQKHIPTLGKIFKADLENRFEDFKFKGDPHDTHDQTAAKKQLAPLKTPDNIAKWRQTRSRIEVVNAGGGGGAHSLEAAKSKIKAELLTNLEPSRSPNEAEKEKITKKLLEQADPAKLLAELREDFKELNEPEFKKLVSRTLGETLLETTDMDTFQRLLTRFSTLSKELNLPDQSKNDIKAVRDALPKKTEQQKDAIVITTTFHNMRMMLTVGDLVGSTCQSYATGGHIETLPGYVMDADVQGIASFGLDRSHFKSHIEFNTLLKALNTKGVEVNFNLDGGKRIFVFDFNLDGVPYKISSEPFKNAHSRRIIKLGEPLEGPGPGFGREPKKQNYHFANDVMDRQQKDIIDELVKDTGGVLDKPMKVSGSRNNGLVYSDTSGGVKTGPYVWNPGK